MQEGRNKPVSIAAQVQDLDPRTFVSWLETRQQAVNKLLDSLKEIVSDEQLDTVAGARIASCVTGSAFGYEEFHPRGDTLPAEQQLDVAATMFGQIKDRELVAGR